MEDLDIMFDTITDKICYFKKELTQLQNEVRKMKKKTASKVSKLEKQLKGKRKKRQVKSGFAAPTSVTPELCEFMGRPQGSKIARTEVNQFITKYVKDHSLQDNADKSKILPDAKMKLLLKLGETEELDFFTIQKKINHLFV